MRKSFRCTLTILLALCLATPAFAQRRGRRAGRPVTVSADTLRTLLFALTDDSMGGRDTGSPGNVKAADWVASLFQRYGLQPAGEGGTWFQTIPFYSTRPDTASAIEVGRTRLVIGRDFVPIGAPANWIADGRQAVYGGVLGDSMTYPTAEQTRDRLVVFAPAPGADLRAMGGMLGTTRSNPRFAYAVGSAIAMLDEVASDVIDQRMHGGIGTDSTALPAGRPPTYLVTRSAARVRLAADFAAAPAGQTGPVLIGLVAYSRAPLRYPARNVVGILRGTDPRLNATYVSVSGHNDHVGFTRAPVDHDSTRAYNRVVRPMGADSPMRPATPDEAVRIQAIRDSLRGAHPAKLDSIFNGADDDGTGTVALVELARVLSQGPRPKRSILFVNHAAEERGLLGSRWYTDHPTVVRDSIVAEVDVDMIGRGGASDLPGGGPGHLELVGWKRLSTEFGTIIESVNARQPLRFQFDLQYDVPGHPLQYYCRADHYSYARFGIPSASLSTGEHLDYHQVTDEAQYIDYDQLARVTAFVHDILLEIANLDHRPLVDGPRGDPRTPCRQ